ncbi:DMT family transporter [Jeotgalibacillus terrae]|uniref:DMT family transporter n=1 Tax=Jeotgalibacillus terrae TaxID=587735 RepID=A0ABW5ZF60_9BACL|nr:DMT family transporter [Jeotgalibacillus terrae]MBM7579269.1 drug/metabolite transporter (DMT)-like permease [Jeotgalibacillus terrae]
MTQSNAFIWLVSIMVAWGLNVVALKVLVEEFSPVAMTSVRILTAGLVVLTVLALQKKWTVPGVKDFGVILLISLFNIVGHHYFLSIGLKGTTAVNTGLILGLIPILTAIAAVIFLKARLTLLKAAGILVGFGGVFLVMAAGSSGQIQIAAGDWYILLAAVTQAISFVLIKKISVDLNVFVLTGWMMITGAILLGMISLLTEPGGYQSLVQGEGYHYAIFFSSAFIATGIGHMIYNNAIRLIGPSESAVFTNLNLLFSITGAALLLGEPVYIGQIAGFTLIVAGVLGGSGAVDHWFQRSRRSVEGD